MGSNMRTLLVSGAVVVSLLGTTLAAYTADAPTPRSLAVPADQSPQAQMFAARCGICHDKGLERVPTRAMLATRTPDAVVAALSTGVMRTQAAGLTTLEMENLANFLTGRDPGPGNAEGPEKNLCATAAQPIASRPAQWNGWGREVTNSRYQPQPGLHAADLPRLAVKWAYGFHGGLAYGQPTVMDGRVFITSYSGRVYSIDARSGCTYWTFDAASSSRTAISVSQPSRPGQPGGAVYFGDDSGMVYGLDAQSGKLLWKTSADASPYARITGAPTLYRDRLYVPVSSSEEGLASNPKFGCCTFRGSVVVMDTRTGRIVWKSYLVPDEPKPTSKSSAGTQLFGPAGIAVWSAPTIDAKRGLVYVGTGNSYTDVDLPMSDAIVALDIATGKVRWVNQVTPSDNWIVGCTMGALHQCPNGRQCDKPGQGNCPVKVGPDYDFGASPILGDLPDGRQIILAGQKSGVVYGLDPDHDGRLIWQTAVGGGSGIGGVGWGPAIDRYKVYVGIADVLGDNAPGGLSALSLTTGVTQWHTPPAAPVCGWGERNCFQAQGQAITVMPGVVFSGSTDGHLRAYATATGKLVWDVDTAKEYVAVNQVKASGGSLNHGGVTVVDGVVYVNSGYGRLFGQPGNVLLAFTIDGK
jgi:polyvinyl alcohol dehydrogenase (cytochrome)